jgi:hypothetical protein
LVGLNPDAVVLTGFCWIAQTGLQSSLVDWIVIDNPKSKLDFRFGLSIQFFHFNPNPKKYKIFLWKLIKFLLALSFYQRKLV